MDENKKAVKQVSGEGARRIIPFMRIKTPFILVSVCLIAAGLFVMATKGFNFGVDFKGGVKLVYQFGDETSEGNLREILEPLHLGEVQVVAFGRKADNQFLIKVKHHEARNISGEVSELLRENHPSVTILSEETVGAKVGGELRRKGFFALILASILILVYVGIRFDFLFAPGAVIALVHDVLVPTGIFAFLGLEINLPILAAALTIIGYSINDTIVIYDRIRENLRKLPASVPLSDLIDRSLTETLSRTIVTSLTVFFAVFVLYLLGGPVLKDFSFYMLIGVVAGTYSTLFMATPVYLLLCRFFPKHGLVRRH